MNRPDLDPFPSWLARLDLAVWVSDERRRLCHVNDNAGKLLRLEPGTCLGRSCFSCVAGCEASGKPYCSERCPAMGSVRSTETLSPLEMMVGPASRRRAVTVLLVPILDAAGAPSLVHCAFDTDRSHRIENYLRRVASRTPSAATAFEQGLRPLTARERQVLELLARDEDLPTIAKRLFISLTTVRNHVQHLLAAMGVHSVAEAVARHLIGVDGGRAGPG